MADTVLVIRYKTRDGSYYYQEMPYNSTGAELGAAEAQVRERAEQVNAVIEEVRWIDMPMYEYTEIPATNHSDALFSGSYGAVS